MAYELEGKIKTILDRQEFPSGFYKQEVVVTTDERFPQDIKLDCVKEKCDLLNGLGEGSQVKVSFDIRGREWNGRYFVDLAVWKLEHAQGEVSVPEPEQNAAEGEPEAVAVPVQGTLDGEYQKEDDDDVPF